jgi:hypothetical protein
MSGIASENQVYVAIPRVEATPTNPSIRSRTLSNFDITNHEMRVTYVSSQHWPLGRAYCGGVDSHCFHVRYRRFEWFVDKCADDCVQLNEQIANIYPNKQVPSMRRSCLQKYSFLRKKMSGQEMAEYFQNILNDVELYTFRFVRMCFEISEV